MSVTYAVVVRLMACSGNEREISPLRGQVYVFPAWQMQTSISSRRAIRICSSFNKTLPLPKPLVVEAGAGETVMPVDVATICEEFETHQDG